jgi:hypothetical protein
MSRPSALNAAANPYDGLDLSGTDLTYSDRHVEHHGPGRVYVAPGRHVVNVPGHTWPVPRPEDCPNDSDRWRWIGGGTALACPHCGLDGT